jgi:hypothetical protein
VRNSWRKNSSHSQIQNMPSEQVTDWRIIPACLSPMGTTPKTASANAPAHAEAVFLLLRVKRVRQR